MSTILVQVIVGGLLLGAIYALFSSGLTLVWGMMNIVNFAHGDFVMLGMYVAFVVYTLLGAGPLLGAPLAVLVLATLGVLVYFGLIRAIMKGPMLAQILGTFGLALLLRYSVFWWFGAHFARLEDARRRRRLHRSATDGDPSRHHAGHRLGDRRGSDGACRRADCNLLLYRADGGRNLGHRCIRHGFSGRFRQRTRCAGGGTSDRGHRVAVGLLDRRRLQGHRGVFAVPVFPLVQAARPDGESVMRRLIWPSLALALVIAYPLLFSTPFLQRLGALVLLYAIAASAWNIVGGYAGQVSVGHVVFFGCGAYAAMGAYAHFGLSPLVGIPVGIIISVLIAAIIGVPTLRLSGHYFSMATIAVAELVRLVVTNTEYLGAAVGLSGPTVPRNVFDLSFISALPYYYLFLAVLLITLGVTWWMTNSRMGFYLRAIKDSERAARSLGAPASRTKLYAFMLSAGLTSVAGALYAMMFGFVDPESGLGILISVKILIMAALGGAGLLFGPLVGAAILVPLEEISNNLLGGKGAGLTFVVYGAIILLIARFQPGGILTLIKRLWAKRN